MNDIQSAAALSKRERLNNLFDRVEVIYLKALRITILMIATLLIAYTLYLAISGLYGVAQSPNSVREAVATVAANEIVDAEETDPAGAAAVNGPVVDPAHRKFYAGFVNRYYTLFRTKFEPYRQTEDKTLSRDEFDDNFVQSRARLAAVTDGTTRFEPDRADLESLITTMSAAAAEPKASARLKRYKGARKVAVKHEVQKTRVETRSGWNSYSTSCPAWYESPIGCPEQRQVDVPYTQTVTAMEFPKGTQSHAQIFRAMQDEYFALLEQRRTTNAANADLRRTEIVMGRVRGSESLGLALRIFGGFIALMFFFLLIAIERHQRRLSAALDGNNIAEGPEPSPAPPKTRRQTAAT